MSKTVPALKGQNLLDIAIQETGSIENVFLIAEANSVSVTDNLSAGVSIIIPDSVVIDTKVKNYFDGRKLKPATSVDSQSGESDMYGIDFMGIEIDFIVS